MNKDKEIEEELKYKNFYWKGKRMVKEAFVKDKAEYHFYNLNYSSSELPSKIVELAKEKGIEDCIKGFLYELSYLVLDMKKYLEK